MGFLWLFGVSPSPPSVSNRKSWVPRPFLRSLLRALLAVIVGCLPPFMSLFRGRRAPAKPKSLACVNLCSHSTYRSLWLAPRRSRGHVHVYAWLAKLPAVMTQESQEDPVSQDEQEFIEFYLKRNRISHLVSKTLLSWWIKLTMSRSRAAVSSQSARFPRHILSEWWKL